MVRGRAPRDARLGACARAGGLRDDGPGGPAAPGGTPPARAGGAGREEAHGPRVRCRDHRGHAPEARVLPGAAAGGGRGCAPAAAGRAQARGADRRDVPRASVTTRALPGGGDRNGDGAHAHRAAEGLGQAGCQVVRRRDGAARRRGDRDARHGHRARPPDRLRALGPRLGAGPREAAPVAGVAVPGSLEGLRAQPARGRAGRGTRGRRRIRARRRHRAAHQAQAQRRGPTHRCAAGPPARVNASRGPRRATRGSGSRPPPRRPCPRCGARRGHARTARARP